jgi:hypothetical protein
MVTYRRLVAEKRLKGTEYPDEVQHILDFFETIGLLVRRGYLDLDDVWNALSYWMLYAYADFRDDIEQEQRDDRTYYTDFCSLIQNLQEIEKREGGTEGHPSKDEIADFWHDETKVLAGTLPRTKRRHSPKPKA